MEIAIASVATAVLVKLVDWLIERARQKGEARVASGTVDTSDARVLFETLRAELTENRTEARAARAESLAAREEARVSSAQHQHCEERLQSVEDELARMTKTLREAGGG